MSLQVWLPLNGNLENKGLANVTITNNGATIDNNGKIGKCYSFNGSSNYISIDGLSIGNNWGYGCWFKSAASNRGWEGLVIYNLSGGDTDIQLGFYTYPGGSKIQSSANGQYNAGISHTYDNQWHHLFATFNGSELKTYKDGVLINTTTITNSLLTRSKLTIGARCRGTSYDTFFLGSVSDFRLYDHCLSEKEVKEISKGLALHYKLDDDYIESTTNIAKYPTPGASIAPGWDTTKHLNAIKVSNWGTGYNSGVNDPTHGYHAMWNMLNDIPTIVFQDKNSEIGQTHRWLGISGGGITTSQITSNTTYTISFEAKADVNGKQVSTGLYYKQSVDGSNNFWDGCIGKTIDTTWKKYTWTYTTGTVYSISSIYIYGHYGTEGTSYIRNIQVELKDHSTPYTPTSRTGSIVYDNSGYGYNGTISGSLITSSDTAKYLASTTFVDSASKIKLPAINFSGMANTYSFSWWAKLLTWNNKMCWGFSDGNRLNYYNGLYWNTGDGSGNPFYKSGTTVITAPSANTWHHIVVTGDGTSTKIYLDGTLYGTAKTYKALTGTQIWMSGWNSAIDYTIVNGQLSDFRIYSTVLSENDVKELYETSASIDKNGNLYCRELVEV